LACYIPAIKNQYNHSYEYVNQGFWECSLNIGCGIYDIGIARRKGWNETLFLQV
ncbi:MAG: hypothetical protein ACI88Z_001171, partial [Sphingobacteriales bacterium]